ncbi:MAG TPA: glycosyltransferase [Thermoleophilaceae bacterium]|nr:glycosyltransferase [Thermoleophilaceae bacterium]
MRVLALGHMYPPQSFGGYEQVWRAAMRYLEHRGHEVLVLTSDLDFGMPGADDPNVRRELRLYWRPHYLPDMSAVARLRLERHNARAFRRHIASFRPDVVTWWSMGGMSLSLIERVRRAGTPSLAFVHDDWLEYAPHMDGWLRPFRGRFSRFAAFAERLTGIPTSVDFARAARYLFVSETTRRRAEEAGVRPLRSGIAHSGIDPLFLDPAPEREWRWSLLYVGRIDERKGVHTAVEALAHLPDAATLSVVGSWDDREEQRVMETARRVGALKRVRLMGQRTPAEVHAAYGQADVVVFPVIWEEPWGLVPLEAMGRGRPVVATGRGGSGEYLRDGQNALLFEAGDEAALARAVVRLAGDPELRRRLREAGLHTAPRHTQSEFDRAVLREVEATTSSTDGRRALQFE